VGQWLLVKDITYFVLTLLAGVPYFFPSWSPYANYAFRDFKSPLKTVLSALFLLAIAYKMGTSMLYLVNYASTIGVQGGSACVIYQDKMDLLELIPFVAKSLYASLVQHHA
jgi:hypothetical protein